MSKSLCIQVTFLTGQYHGQEWPPSPARLFQALLAGSMAGWRRTTWSDQDENALLWLEGAGPPEIIHPYAQRGKTYSLSVPNNNMDIIWKAWANGGKAPKSEEELRILKDVTPHVIEHDADSLPTVRYVWDIADADEAHARRVAVLARSLLALGHGIDMVAGAGEIVSCESVCSMPGERICPVAEGNGGGTFMRVPAPGFLRDLQDTYRRFCGRIEGQIVNTAIRPTKYGEARYRSTVEPPGRGCSAYRLDDGAGGTVSVRWKECMVVAAWMRHATGVFMRQQGRDGAWVDSYILGHTTKDNLGLRLSYVPLPSIGHPNADGAIRRVLVVEPPGFGAESKLIGWGMLGAQLTAEGATSSYAATLAEPEPDDGVIARYLRESDTWLTVTPMVLHGRVSLRGRLNVNKVDKLILQALHGAGLNPSIIEEMWFQRAPLWRGCGDATSIDVPEHLKQWPRFHVGVKLRRSVRGPIIAGIGRHYGIGVFAAP